MRKDKLQGVELEKLMTRAIEAWMEDDSRTLTWMRQRFGSQLPMAELKRRLANIGMYPRPKLVFTMSNLRMKANVPGLARVA
jgi:hypothetical protein